ncbi:lytic transglycosylase domain-containing protein [Nonomuraea sp. NEAU-A123]|uniref:lytic transglycosylase domain-containing protein n=1 Tax=Nonomuraea sp. NEAU-A123 TaxID=2839649 RepID=UPI001BE3CFBE|nr:lytic transglycosylase domain-containing protein [Nonomuraea sp. NEAU-A123]MBT2227276.1 lytic transglycosylase domain-containing protein [Nonomuraea sp. NEAU-A123]
MDSTRALRYTFITLTALATVAGPSTLAGAASESRIAEPPIAKPRIYEGSWHAPVIRTRTWTTAAKPKIKAAPRKTRSKGFALDQVVQRAWSYQEFQCLDNLWTRESNWNHRAYNSSSGAYGIPQALPGGKMRGAGPDWKSNPETQIRWGLAYIKGRYGRPCGAWGHFRSHNWY